jgi:hypothetical protein
MKLRSVPNEASKMFITSLVSLVILIYLLLNKEPLWLVRISYYHTFWYLCFKVLSALYFTVSLIVGFIYVKQFK